MQKSFNRKIQRQALASYDKVMPRYYNVWQNATKTRCVWHAFESQQNLTLAMKLSRLLASSLISIIALSLSSCVSYGLSSVKTGQTEQEVVLELGKPTHIYQDGDQHLWEYMRGRMAQATHMARFDHDGRLISYEQVLTLQKFAEITVGSMDKNAVIKLIGAPGETAYYPRVALEAWSYPYKESGVWNSLMTVYFDQSGIVKKLENGPDPLFDPSERRLRF